MTLPGPARIAAAGAALALAAGLAGCISLLPKAAPVQLYRFDAQVQPVQTASRPVAVRLGAPDFPPGSAGDRIMTVSGDQVAYIGGGRWVSPASRLFEEAVQHGFEAPGDHVRLIGPAQGKAEYRLRLDVRRFEARYTSGPNAPPTVVVVVHATLDRNSDLAFVGAKEFEADVPASDNRIGAIVQAYDGAVTKVVGDLVAWVGQTGGG